MGDCTDRRNVTVSAEVRGELCYRRINHAGQLESDRYDHSP